MSYSVWQSAIQAVWLFCPGYRVQDAFPVDLLTTPPGTDVGVGAVGRRVPV